MSSINLNEVMPFILLLIPWVLAVRELIRHFRKGRMVAYLRRGSEPVDDQPASSFTTLKQHPISYRLLFGFYSCIGIIVPIAIGYALYTRMAP